MPEFVGPPNPHTPLVGPPEPTWMRQQRAGAHSLFDMIPIVGAGAVTRPFRTLLKDQILGLLAQAGAFGGAAAGERVGGETGATIGSLLGGMASTSLPQSQITKEGFKRLWKKRIGDRPLPKPTILGAEVPQVPRSLEEATAAFEALYPRASKKMIGRVMALSDEDLARLEQGKKFKAGERSLAFVFHPEKPSMAARGGDIYITPLGGEVLLSAGRDPTLASLAHEATHLSSYMVNPEVKNIIKRSQQLYHEISLQVNLMKKLETEIKDIYRRAIAAPPGLEKKELSQKYAQLVDQFNDHMRQYREKIPEYDQLSKAISDYGGPVEKQAYARQHMMEEALRDMATEQMIRDLESGKSIGF